MRIMALIQSQYRAFLSQDPPYCPGRVSYLCEHKFSFLWDKYPEERLLGYMEVTCLLFKNPAKLYCRWLYHFLSPLPMWSDPVSPHPRQPSVLSPFFNFKYSDSFRMISCISLLPNGVEHLHVIFCHVNILFSEIYLCLLPNCNWIVYFLLSFSSPLYILNTILLLDMRF